MGADWIRKSEERFRHRLQEAAHSGLRPMPLFPPEEETTVTYACHWLHEDLSLPVGTLLTIFRRGDGARIAVMHASRAVAEVRGEAARDLKDLFTKHPELRNMLPVTIVRVSGPSEPFYVQPVRAAAKKRAKAAR
jgi:hypothetical protein